MMGAACIMAAINAARGTELAYVFGGDGATILAPDCLARDVDRALTRTRRLARDEFDLFMRAGSVSLGEIRSRGADVRVAMYELSPGNRVAMFSGGGAALADRLVKCDDTGAYVIPDLDNERPDLKGLSCRWEPLAARHGCMMCVLAYAIPEHADARARIYGDLIAGIEQALQPDFDAARPVRPDNMRFRWPPRGLGLEAAATCAGRPRGRIRSLWRPRASCKQRRNGSTCGSAITTRPSIAGKCGPTRTIAGSMMCCGWCLTARRSSDAPSRRSSPPRTGEATSSMACTRRLRR